MDVQLAKHAEAFHVRTSFEEARGVGADAPGRGHVEDAVSARAATSSIGSAGKVAPVALSWKRLHYAVPIKDKKDKLASKLILKGVQGALAPGHLLAVMGSTGSGKTSCLSCLAGRVPLGHTLSGEVLVNGKPRDDGMLNIAAYVMQDDALFSCLTVRETLNFSAALRLPAAWSGEKKKEVAEAVMAELGLMKAAETRIGSDMNRGVSGGERKRCNIGVEMLGNPSVIFLDEPTSGLDSFQALSVMEAMCALAHNGRTVISTIHQPRSSIYAMFDLLLLLSEGEQTFFGRAREAIPYFAKLGFACPENYNPADYFIDVCSIDFRTPEAEARSRGRVKLLTQAAKVHNVAPDQGVVEVKAGGSGGAGPQGRYAASFVTQFLVLFRRCWLQISREKIGQIIAMVQAVLFSLILGALYSETGHTQKNIQDRIGVLFFICVNQSFGALFAVINVFPAEKGIVNRERAGRAYATAPLYLAKVFAESPWRLPSNLVFGTITYWLVGLNSSAECFGLFLLILILLSFSSQALGLLVSAAAPNQAAAGAIGPFVTIVVLLFAGFYLNADSIPLGAQWLQYFSHLRYAFLRFCIVEFSGEYGDTAFVCDTACAEYAPGGASCVREVEITEGCLKTGDDILQRLSFDDKTLAEALLGQLGLQVLWHVMACLCLERSLARYQPLADAAGASK